MTHGSVFSSAGQTLTAALAGLLPGWAVLYQPPLNESEMMGADGCQVVYIDPAGDSEIEPLALRGWRETCPLVVVFHLLDRRGQFTQAQVDDTVAEAVGALLDWVTANHRPAGATPDGWDSVEFRVSGLTRQGGYLENIAGTGRRVEVTVIATASRC